jgi:hypothetical protein
MTISETWLADGEDEIISGFGNKIGFWGGPGGRLVLTNKRLLFTNRRKTRVRWECLLRDILHAGPSTNATIWAVVLPIALLIPNAIKITLKSSITQRFVVNDCRRWIALIGPSPNQPLNSGISEGRL